MVNDLQACWFARVGDVLRACQSKRKGRNYCPAPIFVGPSIATCETKRQPRKLDLGPTTQ